MNTADLPILEPLDRATEEALAPIPLSREDHLYITLTDDGEDFYCIAFKGLTRDAWSRLPETIRAQRKDEIAKAKHLHHRMVDGSMVFRDSAWCSWAVRDWFNKIPERKYLGPKSGTASDNGKKNHWVVRGTDVSALMIQHAWCVEHQNRIAFSEGASALFKFLLLRFYGQNDRARLQAEYKLNKQIPEMPADFRDKEGVELADYQKLAMLLGLRDSIALFCEQGTGKTPIIVAIINLLAKRARAGKLVNPATGEVEPHMLRAVLVVPRQVRRNWQNEFRKFSTVPGKTTVVKGQRVRRIKLYTRGIKTEPEYAFSVIIISYDTAANDIDFLCSLPLNIGAADESQMFKNPDSKRWRVGMSQLREACQQTYVLTGTPTANSLMDIWTQLEFLGRGLSGFTNFKAFKEFHGKHEHTADGSGGSVRRLVGIQNVALIQERLSRLTFRITKAEAGLNLPDKVYDTWEVEMTVSQEKAYQSLARTLAAEVEEGLASGKMTVDHILTKMLRLAQICSGYMKLDDEVDEDTGEVIREGQLIPIADPNPKIEAAIEMMQSKDPEEKAIFWCTWIQDILDLEAAFKAAGIDCVTYYGKTSDADRLKAEDRFNEDPSCRVFIGNPSAAGAGLNLLGYPYNAPEDHQGDTYCDLVVFYSQDWSMIKRSQAEDRAHRRGTKMPVTIRELVVCDTIDEEIRNRVESKAIRAEAIQDISVMLKRVLNINVSNQEVA